MKILITGGAGYIGYSLIQELLSQLPEASLSIYDNLSRKNLGLFYHQKFDAQRIKFIRGDILDIHLLKKHLEGIELVIHLAAKTTPPDSDLDSHHFEQINHWGTSLLADLIAESESIQDVIYLSSSNVYGDDQSLKNETDDVHPYSFYARSKYRGEKQLNKIKGMKNVYILRSGNVYGFNPMLRYDTVVNKFMFDAHFEGRILINGDGEQSRSFIHINKLCSSIRQIIQKKPEPNIYNIAEHNLSINQLVEKLLGLYPNLEYLSINQNSKMKNNLIQIPTKISEILEWSDSNMEEELLDFKNSFSF